MASDASESRASLQSFLLDPDYWTPRLRRLESIPRHLVVLPRPDLSRPGIEVSELRLRAHDGERLQALLGRPAFGLEEAPIHVRPCAGLAPEELDWHCVEEGESDLIFRFPPDRRLEDRVLDVVRMSQALRSLESIARAHLELKGREAACDELAIAALLQDRGWI